MDMELIDFIRGVLISGGVCVYSDETGNEKEYTVPMSESQYINLTRIILSSTPKETKVKYTVCVGDIAMTEIVISSNKRVFTPDEQAILGLFNLCAKQVIAQEMRMIMKMGTGRVYHS